MVEDIRVCIADEVRRLWLSDGRTILLTADHPVYVDGRWIAAGQLEAGMQPSGTLLNPTLISNERYQATMRVYDLTVSPHPTFFANGILVHNKTVAQPATEEDFLGSWVFKGHDGHWYRLDLEPGGKGSAAYALKPRIERHPIELISWSIDKFDVEVRLRRSNDRVVVMKGHGSHYGLRHNEGFTLDGLTVERPERLARQLRAIGVLDQAEQR